MVDDILAVAEVLKGNCFKLWVLLYICELSPEEIVENKFMAATTVSSNLYKAAMYGKL